MKHFFLLTAALFSTITMTAADTCDTVVVRIKGMRCEECAHKVTTILRKVSGIRAMDFNLERRTVAIAYDPSLTTTDTISARLARSGRYKATSYDPGEVIRRGIGLHTADMHCQRCADRISERLQQMEGVDSVATHTDKRYTFVRYDANRTTKAAIRQAVLQLGFTPVSYYSSKNISYAYYDIPPEQCNDGTIDEVLALDGVDDVNVNARRGSLAVTFVNTETTAGQLLEAIRAAGIEATEPPAHECKEEQP